MNKKEIVSFRKVLGPSEKIKLNERIKNNGTIETIKIKFYQGQRLALKIRPLLMGHGDYPVDLISYADDTDTFITGDDDYFIFDINIPASYDSYLEIQAENQADFDVNIVVDIVVDYFGGQKRVL